MTFQPSKFQQAIFDWTEAHIDQPGALIVEAVAGSGKTTTIVQAADMIPTTDKAVFLAFNKSIATELGNKLPDHVESKTLNALGFGACRYNVQGQIKVERNKTRDLIRKHLDDDAAEVMGELMNLIGKAKSHGLIPSGMPVPNGTYEATTEKWTTLMDRYDIDPNGIEGGAATFIKWADVILREGLKLELLIDFDDQLYHPVALNYNTWGYDWIIIDEAQDVSHVQRVLLRKFFKSRLIAVGDSRQAIYGFRGADSNSLANIGRVFKAETLPLSISYRCPRKVVEVAQQIVPHIECSDTANDGEVLHPKEWQIDSFSETDLVVCRNTAPLIELAYKCIAEGKAVHVMGREIGKGLINVIRKAGGRNHLALTLVDFEPKLIAWTDKQLKKAKDDETKQAAVTDKLDCLRVLGAGLDTVTELVSAIEKIFDDRSTGTTLATVHKAKGLEAERVFILEPDLMPSPWARKEWQIEQENNLLYVAVTRALETLVYLPLSIVG